MPLAVICVLLILSSSVNGATFYLEPHTGNAHSNLYNLSQVECLDFCSKDRNCCAFAFPVYIMNNCYIYTNCKQSVDVNTIKGFDKWAYYRKEASVSVTSDYIDGSIITTPATTKVTTIKTLFSTVTATETTPITTTLTQNINNPTTTGKPTTPTKQPTTTTKNTTTPKPVLIDPIFSNWPCRNANKSVIALNQADEPMNQTKGDPWSWCKSCRDHAFGYDMIKNNLFSDADWIYAINRGNGRVCDLLVECNLNKVKNNLFYINGKIISGRNYVRITWDPTLRTWNTKNDWKRSQPAPPPVVHKIECKL